MPGKFLLRKVRTEASEARSRIASSAWLRESRRRGAKSIFTASPVAAGQQHLRAFAGQLQCGMVTDAAVAPVMITRLPARDGMSAAFQGLLISVLDVSGAA